MLNGVTATLIAFTVQRGFAGWGGGGISNQGDLTLRNSTVTDCVADWGDGNGGGIDSNGSLTLINSAVTGNAAWYGGGIASSSGWPLGARRGSLVLENSTVSGNHAEIEGGGILAGNTTVRLHNVTISGNTAGRGGGIGYLFSYAGNPDVTWHNTLVAGNTAETGPDCDGPVQSEGYNLLGDGAGCNFVPATDDRVGVPAKVVNPSGAPGLPKYAPLLPDSPAIDAGDPAGCKGFDGRVLETDQRGAARAGRCDIGAYEYTAPGPPAIVYPFAGTPQHRPPGAAFGTLEAQVLDSIGSPVPGVLVTFVAPAAGPSGTFAGTGAQTSVTHTAETGIAAAPVFTANAIPGSYTVKATVTGLTTPAIFSQTNATWTWFVAADGNNLSVCTSPGAPCATVNGVLAKPEFTPGETIRVSGNYGSPEDMETRFWDNWCYGRDSQMLRLNKDAVVSGGWNRSFTAQEGRSAVDGIYVTQTSDGGVWQYCQCIDVADGVTATIEGFTFDGCRASNQGTLTVRNFALADFSNSGVVIMENGDNRLRREFLTRNLTIGAR